MIGDFSAILLDLFSSDLRPSLPVTTNCLKMMSFHENPDYSGLSDDELMNPSVSNAHFTSPSGSVLSDNQGKFRGGFASSVVVVVDVVRVVVMVFTRDMTIIFLLTKNRAWSFICLGGELSRL